MNLTQEELQAAEQISSPDEWNAFCDRVKRARGGAYPTDWWPNIMQSGLAKRVMARWNESPEIKADALGSDGTWRPINDA